MTLFLTFLRSEQIGVVSSCQCSVSMDNGPLMIIKVVTPNTSIQHSANIFCLHESLVILYQNRTHLRGIWCSLPNIGGSKFRAAAAALPWHVKTIQMVPLLKALKLIKGSFIQFCDAGLRCWPSEFSDLVLSSLHHPPLLHQTPSPAPDFSQHRTILFSLFSFMST